MMGLTRPYLLDEAIENDEVILTDEETNHHWQEYGNHSILPIMPQTVTKPAVQTVESILKPNY